MRLLLDEQLSADIADGLRARGHDAVAVQDADRRHWRGLSDPDVFDLAQAERRAIVTENVPHFRACADQAYARARPHHGLIYTSNTALPRHRHDAFVRAVTARLDDLLRRYPDNQPTSFELFL